jgi:2-succinyl-6-hydroxy-2,4-cyclohexadiene-1-carboxylate synthase
MELHYEFVGDRALPPIVFLHGFLGCGADFREIAARLADRYCSLLIDLPGHGASLLTDDRAYAMPATADLIVNLLRSLECLPANLYGYSMGGRLALYLALYYPQNFARVMLESASPGCRTEADRQQRQQSDRALADRLATMAAPDFPDFLRDWYAQPLWRSLQQHPDFATLYHQRLPNHPQFLAKSLLGLGTGFQPRLWDRIAHHRRPLHLLAGALDPKFVQVQTAMQAIVPTATTSVIQQTGHNLHWENPAAVIREIASFFTGSNFYNRGT